MTADLEVRIDDPGVMVVTIDRPAKRNALSTAVRDGIVDALDRAAADDAIGAVVLTGAGGHFCAGFDLAEVAAAADPVAYFAEADGYHRRVHTFPKPLIAAIEGVAVAGGLDLALMCDLRLAAPGADLGQPQVRQGLPAAQELVAAVVGDAVARELCLTGDRFGADEALRRGLVHRLVEDRPVLEAALELAHAIAATPGSADAKARFVAAQPPVFGA